MADTRLDGAGDVSSDGASDGDIEDTSEIRDHDSKDADTAMPPLHPEEAPWERFEGECAPDDLEPIPLESGSAPKEPLGEDGEVVWQVSTACHPDEVGTARRRLHHAVIDWEGEPREVLVTTNLRHHDHLLEQPLSSIAVIDAVTGEQVVCFDAPVEATSPSASAVLTTDPPAVYLTYATATGEGPEDRRRRYGLWGQELAPKDAARRLIDKQWVVPDEYPSVSDRLAVTRDGLVLLRFGSDRLLALDARSGEYYWELDRTEVPEARPVDLLGHSPDEGFRLTGSNDAGTKFFDVDRCGQTDFVESFGELPSEVKGIEALGEYYLHATPDSTGLTVKDSALQEIFRIPDCGSWKPFSEFEVVCGDRSHREKGAIFSSLQTREYARIDLEELLGAEFQTFLSPEIPLETNSTLLNGGYYKEAEDGLYRVFPFVARFVPPQEEAEAQIDVLYEFHEPGTEIAQLLSQRGLLYFRQEDKLYAVQLPARPSSLNHPGVDANTGRFSVAPSLDR